MKQLLDFYLNVLLKRKKQSEAGFNLVELLVVIVIIGILSSVALPAFLNQANRARQAEAQQYLGSFSRSQVAFYQENGRFATNLAELQLGIPTETDAYIYAFAQDSNGQNTVFQANPKQPGFPGAAARAFVNDDSAPTSVLCTGNPGQVPVMTNVELETQCPQ